MTKPKSKLAPRQKTFKGYLTALRPEQRAALQKLRKAIRAAVPKAEECISYGVPAFRLNGRFLVALAASSNHCSFYPGSSVQAYRADLKGYDTSKGTVRFQSNKPLPAALVRKLVKARIAKGGFDKMKLKAPPYPDIGLSFEGDESPKLTSAEKAAIIKRWPEWWPAYREVLLELFSDYDYEDLLLTGIARVSVEKLVPNKKTNDGANLLLHFSFDDTGITRDIFQKDRTIVHAQPAF